MRENWPVAPVRGGNGGRVNRVTGIAQRRCAGPGRESERQRYAAFSRAGHRGPGRLGVAGLSLFKGRMAEIRGCAGMALMRHTVRHSPQ